MTANNDHPRSLDNKLLSCTRVLVSIIDLGHAQRIVMGKYKAGFHSLLLGLLLIWTSGCTPIALPPPTAAVPGLTNHNFTQSYPMTPTRDLSATEQITQATQAAYAFINLDTDAIVESSRMTETVKFDNWIFTTTTESEVGGNLHLVQSSSPDSYGSGKSHLYKVDDVYYCQRGEVWHQGTFCINPDSGAFYFMALMLLGIMSNTTEIDAISIQAVQPINQTEEDGTHLTVYHYTSQINPYNTSGDVTLWMRQSDGRPFRALMIGKLPVNSDQLQSIEIKWVVEYDPSIVIKRPNF